MDFIVGRHEVTELHVLRIGERFTIDENLPVSDFQAVSGNGYTPFYIIVFEIDGVIYSVILFPGRNVKYHDISILHFADPRKAIRRQLYPGQVGRYVCSPEFLMSQRKLQRS